MYMKEEKHLAIHPIIGPIKYPDYWNQALQINSTLLSL